MTTRGELAIGAALAAALFGAGAVVGRATAPVKVVEVKREQMKEVERAKEGEKTSGTLSVTASVTGLTRTVERRYRPDGTLAAVRSSTTGTEAKQATQAQAVQIRWLTKDRIVTKEVEVTKIIETPYRPRWHIMASGGVTLVGEKVWSVGLARYLWGPFSVGVTANTHGGSLLVMGSF